jgi:hypothetical protein
MSFEQMHALLTGRSLAAYTDAWAWYVRVHMGAGHTCPYLLNGAARDKLVLICLIT